MDDETLRGPGRDIEPDGLSGDTTETAKIDEPLDRFDLEELLPHLINRAGVSMANVFQAKLQKDGLTLPMWRVLSALHHSGEQRQIDLAVLTSIEESTLSRLVSKMVESGLIARRRSDTSNREVSVSLMPRGRELAARYIPVALEFEDAATEGISQRDLRTMRRSLRRIHANLNRLEGRRGGNLR